jgi:hypothetical protein
MINENSRKVTRSPVWPETEATLTYMDKTNMKTHNQLSIRGGVGDLGSSGMFFLTKEDIPLNTKVDIAINFDPGAESLELTLSASGKTVRSTKDGVGIKFTAIDLNQLQKCIISRLNYK